MLLTGSTVPLPVSSDVINAFTGATITTDDKRGDGFSLTFALPRGLTDYGILADGTFDPFTRVVIAVVMGVVPQVLFDGWVTHTQVAASDRPGMSTLTVMGKDLGAKIDLEEKNAGYPLQPDSVIATRLIAPLLQYGVIPAITPTTDIPPPFMRIPFQHETDRAFLERLAKRNGFAFYFEPVTIGVSKAYWGPAVRAGLPQPALTINMGPNDTATTIDFANDALAPESPSGTFIDPVLRLSWPIPDLPSLRIPPFALSSAVYRKTIARDTANATPSQAALKLLAANMNAPDSISGTGELETVRYGSILRARGLVGVRGAGLSYDGVFYVSRVEHVISIGNYRQRFSIRREGTGATLPVVPT